MAMRNVLLLLFLILSIVSGLHFALPTFRAMKILSTSVATAQYGPQAVSLFNNMKTPATILAGAIVPLGLGSPLPLKNPDGKKETKALRALRLLYSVAAILSLTSELISVMWSTVAVNQLIETHVAPATSVWELLKRDYDLPWVATNAHFVAGMWGFLFLIGTRAYFQSGGGLLGTSLAGLAVSALMLMVAIVNRGVASGSGDGFRYGTNVLYLWTTYISLLLKRAFTPGSFGPLELGSTIVMVVSLIYAGRALREELKAEV